MKSLQTFRINTPTVVAEAFDDEIVILHLESGTYYSLEKSGAIIWTLLQEGVNLAEISARIATTDAISEQSVQHFRERLLQEKLIISDHATAPSSAKQGIKTDAYSLAQEQQFTSPHLHKYTDMQDLLLLDPIHDVTKTGWPHVPAR